MMAGGARCLEKHAASFDAESDAEATMVMLRDPILQTG
jgi:hypothetical protein